MPLITVKEKKRNKVKIKKRKLVIKKKKKKQNGKWKILYDINLIYYYGPVLVPNLFKKKKNCPRLDFFK